MNLATTIDIEPASVARVLLVADWNIDPAGVVATATRTDQQHRSAFRLLVPALLHGVDWVGDPQASCPCARRQLESVVALASRAGLTIDLATVGDPDAATAVLDALTDWPADNVLLCVPRRRLPRGPFDLARRARRLTRLPVHRVAVAPAPAAGTPGRWPRRAGHCGIEAARPSLT
jgi:hypothetical protein